ncbi:TetR/AcrR family transcriptional regulator [Paenibacillus sp. GP183]|jgi:AcrR family transcriptional regulator|uniref:TetR/AcrR family transcriptional regulator n=1 Tax=Paenibacillus sp. GP183 TaxID=1882751 RepID=UPI00089555BC|nr:TetR/AcrR family transcriptional regulator [Paenibacillus sp. GP183]SEB43383.1 transcriptional regulator, TetR family [Paenibacillus sp. GP183]
MSEMEQWLAELIKLNDEDDKMTEKQIKIVQAAVEIFSEKGYSGSSTSEIAQKAGVAEGTIFRHYKTKKDLLLSIVAPTMTKLIAPFALKDFTRILEADYPEAEDFLRAVIRNRMEFARKNTPVIKIFLHEIPFHAELQAQFKELAAKQVVQRAEKAVKHFQSQGKMIELPSSTAIRLIATTIIGLILSRFLFLPEADWDEDREIEYTIDYIMHGLAPR